LIDALLLFVGLAVVSFDTSSPVELPFEVVNNTDLMMVICLSALIILALVASRNNSILRSHGVVFIALYAGYLFYVTTR